MAEKRKRRQHLSRTQNSTNNRGCTVLSWSWQFTSSVIFAFDYQNLLPSSFGHHTWTRRLQTCNAGVLWLKWKRGRHPSLLSGNYRYISFFFFFITMLFVDNCSLSYTQRQDWSEFHNFFFFCLFIFSPHLRDFSVTGTQSPSVCWPSRSSSLCFIPDILAFLVARWGCYASACVMHVDLMTWCLASLILKLDLW